MSGLLRVVSGYRGLSRVAEPCPEGVQHVVVRLRDHLGTAEAPSRKEGDWLCNVEVNVAMERSSVFTAKTCPDGYLTLGFESLGNERCDVFFYCQGGTAVRKVIGPPECARAGNEERLWYSVLWEQGVNEQIGYAIVLINSPFIGFEFETGWTALTCPDGGEEVPLKKHERIFGLGSEFWKVESDDDGKIEFITNPLPVGYLLRRCEEMFGNISQLCEHMAASAQATASETKSPVLQGNDVQTSSGVAVLIRPPSRGDEDDAYVVAANPQATMDLTLAQLLAFRSYASCESAGYALRAAGGLVDMILTCLEKNDVVLSDGQKGLIALAASYVRGGSGSGLSYRKQITDGFVLSRTRVDKLVDLLPHK